MLIFCQTEGRENQMEAQKTAAYKIISDAGGNRYRFYCELSGALACTTEPIRAKTPEEELRIAWETVGKKHLISAINAEDGSSMPFTTPTCGSA